jgi:hypothetical protein
MLYTEGSLCHLKKKLKNVLRLFQFNALNENDKRLSIQQRDDSFIFVNPKNYYTL